MRSFPALSMAAALALCACASEPKPPAEALRAANNAVAEAEDARASDYAPQEMRSARDKLQAARALSRQAGSDAKSPDAQKARWLAEEASADAALAQARAQNLRAQARLRERRGGGGQS